MAFAAGRDDESEALGRAVEEHILIVSTYIVLMMQGVQTAQLMDHGEALALETLEAAIKSVPTVSEVSDQLRKAMIQPTGPPPPPSPPRPRRRANFLDPDDEDDRAAASAKLTPRRTFQFQ